MGSPVGASLDGYSPDEGGCAGRVPGAPCLDRVSAQAWSLPPIHPAAALGPATEGHVEGPEHVFYTAVLSRSPFLSHSCICKEGLR